MGQYHLLASLTKREFIDPHKIGCGLKQLEQVGFEGSTADVLFLLVSCSNGRGGGDAREPAGAEPVLGRWAGDRVAVVGDYSEAGDLPASLHADTLYARIRGRTSGAVWRDISDLVIPLIERNFAVRIVTDSSGWRNRELAEFSD